MIAPRRLTALFLKPYPNIIWKYPPSAKTIYLTFDDGPYPPVTKPLLAWLKEKQIPATFFLSGKQIYRYRREMGNLDYSDHQIGSHSFYHLPLFGLERSSLLRQIEVTDRLILKYVNRLPNLFRPPYGNFNPIPRFSPD